MKERERRITTLWGMQVFCCHLVSLCVGLSDGVKEGLCITQAGDIRRDEMTLSFNQSVSILTEHHLSDSTSCVVDRRKAVKSSITQTSDFGFLKRWMLCTKAPFNALNKEESFVYQKVSPSPSSLDSISQFEINTLLEHAFDRLPLIYSDERERPKNEVERE